MKYLLYIVILLPLLAFAQPRDMRGIIEIPGGTAELKVTPSGRIFINGYQWRYYADSIGCDWHRVTGNNKPELYGNNKTHFFNRDTAIRDCAFNAEYQRTEDGGKHWMPQKISGLCDCCMEICSTLPTGSAWIRDRTGRILFSRDYGKTWQVITANPDEFYESFCMANDSEGVGITLEKLVITANNWATMEWIAVPKPQSLMTLTVTKADIWSEYVVAQQHQLYYSKRDKIEWHELGGDIGDYEIDRVTGRLYALCRNGDVRVYTSPKHYTLLNKQHLPLYYDYSNLHLAGSAAYFLAGTALLCKVTADTTIVAEPCTNECRISLPNQVVTRNHVSAGIKGASLVICNDGVNWYREYLLPFKLPDPPVFTDSLSSRLLSYTAPLSFLSDSEIMIWNGHYQYEYNLVRHQLQLHKPHFPGQFFESPVRSISLQTICDYIQIPCGTSDKIIYKRVPRSDSFSRTVLQSAINHCLTFPCSDTGYCNKKTADSLVACLKYAGEHPGHTASVMDIFPELKEQVGDDAASGILRDPEDKARVDSMARQPNILAKMPLSNFIPVNARSLDGCTLDIAIVNDNNDTLRLSSTTDYIRPTWGMPWLAHYHNDIFNYSDANFSRLLNRLKPPIRKMNGGYALHLLILQITYSLMNP